jgi:hypothetical protein
MLTSYFNIKNETSRFYEKEHFSLNFSLILLINFQLLAESDNPNNPVGYRNPLNHSSVACQSATNTLDFSSYVMTDY